MNIEMGYLGWRGLWIENFRNLNQNKNWFKLKFILSWNLKAMIYYKRPIFYFMIQNEIITGSEFLLMKIRRFVMKFCLK